MFKIGKDEELILDITQSFRSIPFLAASSLVFSRFMDGFERGRVRIMYGAFDQTSPDLTRIWELTSFIELIRYTSAIQSFTARGQALPFSKLLKNEAKVMKDEGFIRDSKIIASFGESLAKFAHDFSTVRTGQILQKKDAENCSTLQVIDGLTKSKEILSRAYRL